MDLAQFHNTRMFYAELKLENTVQELKFVHERQIRRLGGGRE